MYPILADLGFIKIYGYGFCIMMGTLLAYLYALKQSTKNNIPSEYISEIALLMMVAAFIGGKVFLWFANLDYYLTNPAKMIEFNGSGFVYYGSFIFCMIALFGYFKFRHLAARPMFDIIAICTVLAQFCGKFGCLLAGCCHGKACSPAVGIVFTNVHSQSPLNTPLYPVQIYDLIIIGVAGIFLFWYRDKKRLSGNLMPIYVLLYGTGRFITEFFRGDSARGFIGNLSQSQWFSIGLVVIAILVLRYLISTSQQNEHAPMHRK